MRISDESPNRFKTKTNQPKITLNKQNIKIVKPSPCSQQSQHDESRISAVNRSKFSTSSVNLDFASNDSQIVSQMPILKISETVTSNQTHSGINP